MDYDFNPITCTYDTTGLMESRYIPETKDPVYILGEKYSSKTELEKIKQDVISRLWITYRKGFPSIGGTGPSCDQGWGCMLRCGQMMLAQCLILRHLGRAWRWRNNGFNVDNYWRILKMFEDKKSAIYSIQQIASMGEAEGKAVGQWFGPNTIAQVLKRISVYDNWSNLAIHVSLDNVVILDEIRSLCKASVTPMARCQEDGLGRLINDIRFSDFVNADPSQPATTLKKCSGGTSWRPLLLIIPLRLGLTEINPIYFDSLKKCFQLKQSVGIIGGKPNHAHWFIGYADDELLFLDPHTSQNVVDLDDRDRQLVDTSYHWGTPPCRMSFTKLDPSIALGFFCHSEEDFENWCKVFSKQDQGFRSMFELHNEAPQAYLYDSVDQMPRKTTRSSPISDFVIEGMSSAGSGVDDEEFEFL